jgi:hypothetical protein
VLGSMDEKPRVNHASRNASVTVISEQYDAVGDKSQPYFREIVGQWILESNVWRYSQYTLLLILEDCFGELNRILREDRDRRNRPEATERR